MRGSRISDAREEANDATTPNTLASGQDIWHSKRHQRIVLPDGPVLPGNDRGYLKDTVFDADVSGQTMLDIGSSQGSFCIEGLRRGMRTATGLEVYPDDIRVARELAKQFGVEPMYVQNDFETWAFRAIRPPRD